MKILKQSTATTILMGPFINSTTLLAETGLTLTSSDFQIWKKGGTSLAAKNESSSGTHRGNGYYTVPIDATDTNTLGDLVITCNESGTLFAKSEYTVVPDHVYDGLVAGSDYLQVDVRQVNSTTEAANQLHRNSVCTVTGTVFDNGTTVVNSSTTVYADDITEATADHYNGRVIIFRTGALAGQATTITDYSLTGGLYGTFTVDALTEAPANDVTFQIV